MLRFKLRTLLIVLALGPPVLAGAWMAWMQHVSANLQRQRLQLETDYVQSRARYQESLLKLAKLKWERDELERNRKRAELELNEAEPGIYFLGPSTCAPDSWARHDGKIADGL